jgi:hypothetical protein
MSAHGACGAAVVPGGSARLEAQARRVHRVRSDGQTFGRAAGRPPRMPGPCGGALAVRGPGRARDARSARGRPRAPAVARPAASGAKQGTASKHPRPRMACPSPMRSCPPPPPYPPLPHAGRGGTGGTGARVRPQPGPVREWGPGTAGAGGLPWPRRRAGPLGARPIGGACGERGPGGAGRAGAGPGGPPPRPRARGVSASPAGAAALARRAADAAAGPPRRGGARRAQRRPRRPERPAPRRPAACRAPASGAARARADQTLAPSANASQRAGVGARSQQRDQAARHPRARHLPARGTDWTSNDLSTPSAPSARAQRPRARGAFLVHPR